MQDKRKCPVCGRIHEDDGLQTVCDCTVCKTRNAFSERFSDRQAFEIWKANMDAGQEKLRKGMQKTCKQKQVLALSNKGVACIFPENAEYQFVSTDAGPFKGKKALQFSFSDRHQVLLLPNGKVEAAGDNDYGQCNVASFSGITHVCAAARCTYGVTKAGRVVSAGIPISNETDQWTEIIKTACGSYHIVGLQKDGRVLIAGNMLDSELKRQVQGWSHVADIASGSDCVIALTTDGRVKFAGKPNDSRREAETWSGIVSAAVESVYVVGLTADGKVMLAGTCKNSFLDLGRAEAKNWREIVAISCSRSGIAALDKSGKLYVAGNVQGIYAILKKYNEAYADKLGLGLIQAVDLKA